MEFDLGSAMYEVPRKPKFEKDFIMLSEFSELVGPVPLCFIPEEKTKGNFNASHFSVRIMSSDFQAASGKLVAQDTQVILSEKRDCAYAYVHYFSLNDLNARGYVRQYALSYISSSSSKIVDNFEELLKEFSEVTAFLKVSNHVLFQRDMSRHLEDLKLTMRLLEEEGYTESTADPNQLYSEFDFTKQDVPERNPAQVAQDMKETTEILASIKHELSKEMTVGKLNELRRKKELRKQLRSRDRAHSFPQDGQMKALDSLSLSVSSTGSSDYEPQRVMTHLVHKFEQRLRPLDELSPQACSIVMDRLHELYKFFSRSELALELEREEVALLAPHSSLLTIGRVPVLNVLQDYSPHPQAPALPPSYNPGPYNPSNHRRSIPTSDFLHQATRYRLSSRNTWGMPNQLAKSEVHYVDDETESGFDTTFLDDKVGLKQHPLYIDSVYSPTRWHTESFATDLPDYECTLSTSRVDTDSDTNFLSIRQDDDDGGSTAFATPEGITPKSSDEEGEAKVANDAVTQSMVVGQGSEVMGGVAPQFLTVLSNSGSLEVSGDSTSYLQSESGSQCTLTESKEGNKTEDSKTGGRESAGKTEGSNTSGGQTDSSSTTASGMMSLSPHTEGSTQVQTTNLKTGQTCCGDIIAGLTGPACSTSHSNSSAGLTGSLTSQDGGHDVDLAGLTGRERGYGCVDRSITPHNGIVVSTDVYDGASLLSRSKTSHYPDMPQHLLSINDTGSHEVVTSEPQANGHCRVQSQHIARSEPVEVVTSSVEVEESEESYSAGSGCYNEQLVEMGVHALITQQGNKKQTTNSPALGSLSSGPLFRIGLGSNSPSPAGMKRSPVGNVMQQQGVNCRGDSLSTGSPSPAPIFGVGHSPVGSIGTASSTCDDQPLLLARGSVKAEERLSAAERPGPVDQQLRRQQSSPDVYQTTTTNFPPNSTLGPPKLPVTQHRYTSPPSHQEDHYQYFPSLHRYASPSRHEDYGPHLHCQYSPSPLSPSQQSFTSITSLETVFSLSDKSLYEGPTILEGMGPARLPLVSTVDHIEGESKFKPGKGIINFCKNTPVVTDLLYCLLHGRPLVLLGKSAEENLIRRLIRVLWLFVPGHSSQRQVITWQETPLDIRDLSRAKLMGLCSRTSHPIGPHVKSYISYWDCNSGKLWTPSYNGELLKPIVSRTKDKKNEEVFLTHIHSVLLEIAMKAFVYYHGYCIAMTTTKRSPTFEPSPRKCHTVSDKATIKKRKMAFLQKLGIRNSDLDIIEYFVDVIREQQLLEWGQEDNNGGPFDESPVRVHLHSKHCADSFCKPKRPY